MSKITYDEYESYLLFATSDIGRKWLDRRIREAFMSQPAPDKCTGTIFAYMDGTRQIFRDLIRVIDKIQYLLEEINNDDNAGSETAGQSA